MVIDTTRAYPGESVGSVVGSTVDILLHAKYNELSSLYSILPEINNDFTDNFVSKFLIPIYPDNVFPALSNSSSITVINNTSLTLTFHDIPSLNSMTNE